MNQSAWRLVFGEVADTRKDKNIDIGLNERHCFYIKDFDVLTSHWECGECQQRFPHHDNFDRHVAGKWYAGGHISSFAWLKSSRELWTLQRKFLWWEYTVLMESLQVDQTPVWGYWSTHSSRIVDHGGEKCVVINKQEILVDRFETSTVYQLYGCKWHGVFAWEPPMTGIIEQWLLKTKSEA